MVNKFSDGTVISTDTRKIEPEKLLALDRLRVHYTEKINASVPEYKQRNIGMGIIVGIEKEELVDLITALRYQANTDEENINNCKTLEDLDNLKLPY